MAGELEVVEMEVVPVLEAVLVKQPPLVSHMRNLVFVVDPLTC